eukprot:COSAG03_NODE_1608_length_3789_cov_6.888347_2_plen_86_part_00
MKMNVILHARGSVFQQLSQVSAESRLDSAPLMTCNSPTIPPMTVCQSRFMTPNDNLKTWVGIEVLLHLRQQLEVFACQLVKPTAV